jgi:hypothetical protein
MPLISGRSPARATALWAFLFHALAVVWVRSSWGPGLGGGVLLWMDFPVSLAYGQLSGAAFLAAALVAGGALWALVAAGLALLVGRAVRPRAAGR